MCSKENTSIFGLKVDLLYHKERSAKTSTKDLFQIEKN